MAGIAILIDWDNLRLRLEEHGIPLNAADLMATARTRGRPVRAAVFGDMTRIPHNRVVELYSAGFTLVHCPRLPNPRRDVVGKDTVDTAMVAEMHELCGRSDVDEVVLGSADRDFLLAVGTLRNAAGKRVIILTATADDRQALVVQADGSVPYVADTRAREAIDDLTTMVMNGDFSPEDPAKARAIEGLAAIVAALRVRLVINSHRYSFLRLVELLWDVATVRVSCGTQDAVHQRLALLKAVGVLQSVRPVHDERVHYVINDDHPFTRHVLPGNGAPDGAVEDLPLS